MVGTKGDAEVPEAIFESSSLAPRAFLGTSTELHLKKEMIIERVNWPVDGPGYSFSNYLEKVPTT